MLDSTARASSVLVAAAVIVVATVTLPAGATGPAVALDADGDVVDETADETTGVVVTDEVADDGTTDADDGTTDADDGTTDADDATTDATDETEEVTGVGTDTVDDTTDAATDDPLGSTTDETSVTHDTSETGEDEGESVTSTEEASGSTATERSEPLDEGTEKTGSAITESNVIETAAETVLDEVSTEELVTATANAIDDVGDEAATLLDGTEETIDEVVETADRVHALTLVTLESDAHLSEARLHIDDRASHRASVTGRTGDVGPVADGGANETAGLGAGPTDEAPIAALIQWHTEPPGGPDDSGEGGPAAPRDVLVIGLSAGLVAGGRRLLLSGSASSGPGTSVIRLARTATMTTVDGGWRDVVRFVLIHLNYRRYDDSDPLDHEARAAIYEHVDATPGTYLSAISAETGVALPTVRYHLKILEYENLVTRRKLRGRRRYFPVGTEPSALAAALADDGAGAVLEALASIGPASVSGLAEALDRDPSTVSYHLQQLAEYDLVDRERDGCAVVNRLPSSVEDVLNGNG